MAKEMYIGATGGYVEQTMQGDIIPKSWTQVIAGTSYKASDGTTLTTNGYYSSSTADKACDNNVSTSWLSSQDVAPPKLIKLTFPGTVKITKMKTKVTFDSSYTTMCKIQGSNNNSTWTDLYSFSASQTSSALTEVSLNNADYYKYYRIYAEITSSSKSLGVAEWQVSEYVTRAYDSSVTNIAHKVKKAYIGVDNKARKIKKGYIGVNGIAKLFYSSKTLVPFTACPYLSMAWQTITTNTKYQGTNDYGTWTIEATSSAGNDYSVTQAFDKNTNNYWISKAMTTDDYVSCAIYLPTGVSINPTSIYVSYGQFKNASIQGLNESTGAWEIVESLSNTTSNSTTQNLSPTVTNYYKAFRVYGTRYSASYNDPRVAAFSIMTGTLKIV